MEEENIISFDLGIKNITYCILNENSILRLSLFILAGTHCLLSIIIEV